MQKAPILQHDAGNVRNFDDGGPVRQSYRIGRLSEFGDAEMIIELLAAIDGVPVAICIVMGQRSEGVAEMFRCPFVIGIQEGHEPALGWHAVKAGIAGPAGTRVGLTDHTNAFSFFIAQRLQLVFRRKRRCIVDDEDIEILKCLPGY
ncbi:conserved hypothetical protein [Ricinus communis]|uniref:Uncharacterized protein n=1 Tax=Ricinus communis TaxID=3988 RepID=B9TLF5_RICCO|nr:conserved hypothetical protein [Ricinus communis]